MSRLAPRLVIGILAMLSANSRATDTVFRVEPPPGFGVRPAGVTEPIVYAEAVAHSPNPISRAFIEDQCEMHRRVGTTRLHPVFEPGHDQPILSETIRFANADHGAEFVTRHVYECGNPTPVTGSADRLCGCTYRIVRRRSVYIDSHDRGRPDPGKQVSRMRLIAPEVIGADTIAGVACVWRRQSLPDGVRIDRCVVEDEARLLPAWLRGTLLAERTHREGGKADREYTSKAVKVILDASVDAGVFAARPADVPREAPR